MGVTGATAERRGVNRSYAVVLAPEAEGGFSVDVPAFRGAHTQGESIEECLANARELIEAFIADYHDRGEALPPSDIAASVAVSLPAA